MINTKNIICSCLYLLLMIGCKQEKIKDSLSLELENTMCIDNYYLFRSNSIYYKIITNYDSLDVKKNETAIRLNQINTDLDNLFLSIRHDFISNLKGNEQFAVDTLSIEQVANIDDIEYTKGFYNNIFKKELARLETVQNELKKLDNNLCDVGLISEIWKEDDISARNFLIRLTMTNNLLNKRIHCIYESLMTI